MSLSDRRGVLVGLGALGLSACGFAPAYAPGGPGMALRGQVRAADPQTSLDFDFVAALEERLGRPDATRFALAYQISVSERASGQVAGLGETRITVFGNIDYTLSDTASGTVVTAGALRNFTNYSTTATQLASLRAREDAEKRLVRILADQVATRLIAALAR